MINVLVSAFRWFYKHAVGLGRGLWLTDCWWRLETEKHELQIAGNANDLQEGKECRRTAPRWPCKGAFAELWMKGGWQRVVLPLLGAGVG